MTKQMPRAPKLDPGTCIATAALIESAQRVFLHHTTSPIHWIDLCTLIEAIFLHERISFPVVHRDYAEPLLGPLINAGLADMWWPEAGIFTGFGGTKEESWRDIHSKGATLEVALLQQWPDERYEALSEHRKKAVDGIAQGFGEPALTKDKNEVSVLLWGRKARGSGDTGFEEAAASWLSQGIEDITKLPAAQRASFNVPHVTARDTYNHYAKHLRDLANDAEAMIVKSVIEEPFFDPVSVETAARDTLQTILKRDYESNVTGLLAKYVQIIPASPFGGIALSKANSLNEVIKIAIDLRDSFGSYRELLGTYRKIHDELIKTQKISLAKELEQIESTFAQALEHCFTRLDPKADKRSKIIFAGLQGIKKVIIGVATGDVKPAFEKLAEEIIELARGWYFMNYGGVYEMVSQFPKIGQLNVASQKLTGRELNNSIADVLSKATNVLKSNYGLTGIGK